jgi:mRNA interferase HigB
MVNVISRRTVREFAAAHADAADELDRWFALARRARWRSLMDVRGTFTDADQFKSLLIFNIRHNSYRLVVKVDYRANLIMVKEFLTHKEYDRGDWKKWAP